jgi:hypothetical protein
MTKKISNQINDDGHTHSPFSVLWRRPESPGGRFMFLTRFARSSIDGAHDKQVCIQYFLSFAFLKNGCFKSSVAVGRLDGSL